MQGKRKNGTHPFLIPGSALVSFDEDFAAGRCVQADLPWRSALQRAAELSRRYTPALGCRTLDVLHVVGALEFGPGRFLTFDLRQRRLARAVGLRPVVLPKAGPPPRGAAPFPAHNPGMIRRWPIRAQLLALALAVALPAAGLVGYLIYDSEREASAQAEARVFDIAEEKGTQPFSPSRYGRLRFPYAQRTPRK